LYLFEVLLRVGKDVGAMAIFNTAPTPEGWRSVVFRGPSDTVIFYK